MRRRAKRTDISAFFALAIRAKERWNVRRDVRIAVVVGFTFLLLSYSVGWVSEDAYISYRFGKNWANGHGVLFNPGMEAVDG